MVVIASVKNGSRFVVDIKILDQTEEKEEVGGEVPRLSTVCVLQPVSGRHST